jgi:transposase
VKQNNDLIHFWGVPFEIFFDAGTKGTIKRAELIAER